VRETEKVASDVLQIVLNSKVKMNVLNCKKAYLCGFDKTEQITSHHVDENIQNPKKYKYDYAYISSSNYVLTSMYSVYFELKRNSITDCQEVHNWPFHWSHLDFTQKYTTSFEISYSTRRHYHIISNN